MLATALYSPASLSPLSTKQNGREDFSRYILRHTFNANSAMYSTSLEDDSDKNRSLCGCLGCFIIWLFPVCLAIGIALFFSPNDRISSIEECLFAIVFTFRYNRRATKWNEEGYDTFLAANFSLKVNGETVPFGKEFVIPQGLIPTGDSCNLEGDPEGGCVRDDFFYNKIEVKVPTDAKSVAFDILHNDRVIINGTAATSSSQGLLRSLCFRVRDENETYVLDTPARWDLRLNDGEAGCEFSNSWEPLRYEKADSEKSESRVEFQVHSIFSLHSRFDTIWIPPSLPADSRADAATTRSPPTASESPRKR